MYKKFRNYALITTGVAIPVMTILTILYIFVRESILEQVIKSIAVILHFSSCTLVITTIIYVYKIKKRN